MSRAQLSSNRGNALLGALATVTVAGIIGSAAIAYNDSFAKTTRINYVRASYATLESTVRSMAMQPYAYNCGEQGKVANQVSDIANCRINIAYFAPVAQVIVPGAKCGTKKECGFVVRKIVFSTQKVGTDIVGNFAAELVYQGQEFKLSPIEINLTVPTEVLQSQVFSCAAADPLNPVFVGFNPDGSPRCTNFPECPQGQYLRSLNFTSMSRTCGNLAPENDKFDCSFSVSGIDQPMLRTLRWQNGVASSACTPLDVPPAAVTHVNHPPQETPPVLPLVCPTLTYRDPGGPWYGGEQNGRVNATIDFKSTVDQIPPGCHFTTADVTFRKKGLGYCQEDVSMPDLGPDGSSRGSSGFMYAGGSGNKTDLATALMNGSRVRIEHWTEGWGKASGNSTQPCISKVVVVVHSKVD